MNIFKKNTSVDSLLYSISPDFKRNLTTDLKDELLSILKSLNVSKVSIRYEQSSETVQFANQLSSYLQENKYKVSTEGAIISEVESKEFSIKMHPSDTNLAILQIGSTL